MAEIFNLFTFEKRKKVRKKMEKKEEEEKKFKNLRLKLYYVCWNKKLHL